MTRLAAPSILACPCCASPMRQKRYKSIHCYGSTRWSDGYVSSISLAAGHTDVGVCPVCEGMFWVEEAAQLGVLDDEPPSTDWPWWKRMLGQFNREDAAILAREQAWRQIPDGWHFAGDIDRPRTRELIWALEHGLCNTPARETRLRKALWWIGNHPDRGSVIQNAMTEGLVRENQVRLLDQIRQGPDEPQRVLIEAELLRQLRRFDEALAVLDQAALSDDPVAAVIADKSRANDAKVCVVSEWSVLN